ncbi:hypothetical protein BD311DRAFT_707447 [Dichomitus squalens]|uniref:RING-type domain-containing protein n=1 Tax=Dichomitus squalens TaxID=114155 RepID=A0A4Q9N8X8_9APHY|nr:hypothetical protein BD311DRAFT_707447 [Dichomitus squalens]
MPSLICRICLETLHEKTMVTTKCGHIFCSACASTVFKRGRAPCPVCRKPHTHGQLIRLFPEWESSEDEDDGEDDSEDEDEYDNDGAPVHSNSRVDHAPVPIHPVITHPEPAPVQYVPDVYVPLGDHSEFPWRLAGEVPAWDGDGTPLYLGTTLFNGGWHPCKIMPYNSSKARVSYGGKEYENTGICHLLPFNAATMEWVPTSCGLLPYGRRAIEGGYEEIGGEMFYHALAVVAGVKVPGKAGPHLTCGASVPYANKEYIVRYYFILCWRDC